MGGSTGVLAEKDHPHAIGIPEVCTQIPFRNLAQERVRPIQEQSTAIAGLAIRGNAATVGHAGQCLYGCIQQLVAGFPVFMGDQPETTVIPVFPGLVQTCHHKQYLSDILSFQRLKQ
jgi:hypothetical protein